MDYNSLVGSKTTAGSIAQWLNVSDAKLDLAGILEDAQAILYNGGLLAGGRPISPLRVRDMRKTGQSLSLTANAWTADLPADFLAPIAMRDPKYSPLTHLELSSLQRRRNVDSAGAPTIATYPSAYAIDASKFLFDFAARATQTLTIDYYARPAALAGGNLTNFLTTKYPHLLRAACLAAAADYMNDDAKYARNVQKLMGMLQSINITDEAEQTGMWADRTYPDNPGVFSI